MRDLSQVTTGYAPVQGGELYYEVAGDGPAVVLVHAGIADLTMWDAQVAALAPRYKVVRFDCRGFGRTRTAPVPFSNRQDVVELLDHLGVAQAALVGCSRGGQIALDLALERPERVRGLVWVCSGVGGWQPADAIFHPDEIALWEAMEAAEAAGEHERVAALDVRLWVDGPLQPEGRADEAVRQQVYAMALNNYRTHAHLFGEGLAPQPLDPPAHGRLGELRAPVLAVVGELDTSATAAAAEVLAAGAPDCRVERLADCAHLPNLERPERFNELLLGFLAGL
ncbi:MAG TPA: alpha/beta hydrolase [Chloroflexaceae bacterium]|nr:alpha/beta hydrolase [Chloroflexaceae bacterium]